MRQPSPVHRSTSSLPIVRKSRRKTSSIGCQSDARDVSTAPTAAVPEHNDLTDKDETLPFGHDCCPHRRPLRWILRLDPRRIRLEKRASGLDVTHETPHSAE